MNITTASSFGLEYHEFGGEEVHNSRGTFGVKIFVAAPEPIIEALRARYAGYDAVKMVQRMVQEEAIRQDPNTPLELARNRELVNLFPEPIFVEEIPNGYCSEPCCQHRPWFVVTTRKGRFKIGWRKRVINIDWTETVGTKMSEELFADEKVTKDTRSIHAWSREDAARYIGKILDMPPIQLAQPAA